MSRILTSDVQPEVGKYSKPKLIKTAYITIFSAFFIIGLLFFLLSFRDLNNDNRDWANLAHYSSQNEVFAKPSQDYVVFIGDSITEFWDLSHYFPGKPYYNRGIKSQVSQQVLLRFLPDVVELAPNVVVLSAGTNDILYKTSSLEMVAGYLTFMAELADKNNIEIIIASILPVGSNREQERPKAQITYLNTLIKNYCDSKGKIYLDYYSALADSNGYLKPEYSPEGLHPNDAGYQIMATLAQTAIDTALIRRRLR